MTVDLESYDDPALRCAGMAGFVAPAQAWKNFADKWQTALESEGITTPFHMKDFAQFVEPYDRFRNDETGRRRLFAKLICSIIETRATPIGAIVSINEFHPLTVAQQGAFLDPYGIAFQLCTRYATLQVAPIDRETVAMVHAHNEEFGATETSNVAVGINPGRAQQLWMAMKKDARYKQFIGAYSAPSPIDMVQLQAVDLFGYELLREFESQIKRVGSEMQWGLKQILQMYAFPAPHIWLVDRKELL